MRHLEIEMTCRAGRLLSRLGMATFMALITSPGAEALHLSVSVLDQAGAPVPDAVVALYPAPSNQRQSEPRAEHVSVLDQVNKQFVPHVLAVHVGSSVSLPNSDNIRHEVYSFSEAKRFRTKLYSGKSVAPLLFDQPGLVVVGCGIHDWMRGYIYILDTSLFFVTGPSGEASFDVTAGSYAYKIWQPRYVDGHTPASGEITVDQSLQSMKQVLELADAAESSGQPPRLLSGSARSQ